MALYDDHAAARFMGNLNDFLQFYVSQTKNNRINHATNSNRYECVLWILCLRAMLAQPLSSSIASIKIYVRNYIYVSCGAVMMALYSLCIRSNLGNVWLVGRTECI